MHISCSSALLHRSQGGVEGKGREICVWTLLAITFSQNNRQATVGHTK